VAGYGKALQIQRLPFRAYYSQIDTMVHEADSFLFIGYGFGDLHLNNCFHGIRRRAVPRPVVVISRSDNDEDPMRWRHDSWSENLCRAVQFNCDEIATRIFPHATPHVAELIQNNEFEVSTNETYPISIWHGGFMRACMNYNLIKNELSRCY
jgi:hypothetical protein